MIELAIGASLVALSAFALRALRTRDLPDPRLPDRPARDPNGFPVPRRWDEPPLGERISPAPEHRGLRVGDVLLHGGDELWIAGTLVVRGDDDEVLFRLHATPGSAEAAHLAQLDERGDDLALLEPIADLPRGELPAALRRNELLHERRFHQEASIEAEGEHLPRHAPEVTAMRWDAPGDRVLLVLDGPPGDRLAWAGRRLERALFELLPGGDLPPEDR